MMWIISTQAATDAMPMSEVIDYGLKVRGGEIVDPAFHLVLHTAPPDADAWSRETWKLANPGLGDLVALAHIERMAKQAEQIPSSESAFRNLCLNQRVAVANPFVSPAVWKSCGGAVDVEGLKRVPVYAGLDLSEAADLTAFVMMGLIDGKWHVHATCWLPREGLVEKAARDRAPYDLWARQGHLQTTPGRAIAYEQVAEFLASAFDAFDIKKIGFDAWRFNSLKPWLVKAGFSEQRIAEHFAEVRQGYKTMAPALRDLEVALLEGKLVHGNHPVLGMCAMHAIVTMDAAGNRKLDKDKSAGRIDAMVALVDAFAVAPLQAPTIDVEAMIG
jgi:phage terminase large subunit-like protein